MTKRLARRATAALDVLGAGLHEHGEGAGQLHVTRPHQTCRPVDQYVHVCVEKRPLTTRRAAKQRWQLRGERSAAAEFCFFFETERNLARSEAKSRKLTTTLTTGPGGH